MAQEVDADRALTAQQNWSAREHRELYEAVHTGNEPGRIGELAREWTRLGTELGEAADTATRRMRSTEQGWQGAAADAARTALQRVLDWSREAGATALSVGDQLDHQGRIMEAAKTSMPEPVEPDPGPKRFSPDGPKDLAGLAGAVEDGHARQERSRAAHDQAVEVMRRMEADSRQVDGSTPRFEPPPNPIEDSAPAPKAAGQDGQPSAGPASQQARDLQPNAEQAPDQQPNGPQATAPSAAPAQAPPAGGAPVPGALGPEAGRAPGAEQSGPAAPAAPVASKVDGRGSGRQSSGSGDNPGKKDRGESKSDGSKDSGKDDSGGKKSAGGDDSHDSESPKSTHSSSTAPPAEPTARLPKPPTPEGGPRPQSFSPAAGGAGGAGWSGSLPQPPAGAGASGGAGSSGGGGRGSGGSGDSLSPGDRSGSGAARGSTPVGGAPSSTAPAGGGQAGASGMTGMAGSPGAGMAGRGGQGQQEQSHSSKYVEGDEELFEVPGDPPPPVIGARKQERQQGRGE